MVCGGPQMVSHTVQELTRSGLEPEDVRFEEFNHVGAGDLANDGTRTGEIE